jgi:hypothetical protein
MPSLAQEKFMPSPLPRLIPRSQKVGLVLAISILFLLVSASVYVIRERSQPAVQKINYTQLRTLGESSAAVSLKISGSC